jgi:hypothetical protein
LNEFGTERREGDALPLFAPQFSAMNLNPLVAGEALRRSDAEYGHQPVKTSVMCMKSGLTFAARAEKSAAA